MVTVKNPWVLFDGSLYECGLDEKNFRLMLLGIVILFFADFCKRNGDQISNMKKRLSSIVREYKFDSVQAFYKEFNAAKKEYFDYQAARAEWEKIYGEKTAEL